MSNYNFKISNKEKVEFVKQYLDGKNSLNALATAAGVPPSTLRAWVSTYKAYGEDGLIFGRAKCAKMVRLPGNGRKVIDVPIEARISAIEEFLSGNGSIAEYTERLGVSRSTFRGWVTTYKAQGREALFPSRKNTVYTPETKEYAVLDFLSGAYSARELCEKYNIRTEYRLRTWVKEYNSHGTFLRNATRERESAMAEESGTKITRKSGKSTTWETKIDIVSYYIQSNESYQNVADKYGVSYQQVYLWVKKYNELGPEGLIDKRGKRKPAPVDELDILREQNRLLTAKNKRLELENEVLKKLKEVERRRF